jgi:hypothetical protein
MRITLSGIACLLVGFLLGVFLTVAFRATLEKESISRYGEFMYGQGYADGMTGTNMTPDKAAVRYEGKNHMDSY